MIRFHVVTIFPEVFPGPLGVGVVGRAIAAGDVQLQVHDLRAHSEGRHRQVHAGIFEKRQRLSQIVVTQVCAIADT